MKRPTLSSSVFAAGSMLWSIFCVQAQTAPIITNQPTSQAVSAGGSVTFSVGVGGAGPFSYQWQLDGTNLPNGSALITTFAGTGNGYFFGDDGPANTAGLLDPFGVALDDQGNLYIADAGHRRIRRVDTNGIITTIAGNGTEGSSGNGGPAINATLFMPVGMCLDSKGNLYFADEANQFVRKIDTNGIITAVAGTGTTGYSGDGGLATNANLNTPSGVALDAAGNLYIGDAGNYRVRRVDPNGIITTFAGTGTQGFTGDGGPALQARLGYPTGLAVDASQNVYVVDHSNSRIRRIDTNGFIATIAGGGTGGITDNGIAATNAALEAPFGLALDGTGDLFIADTYNYCVREVNTQGTITTVAGNGGVFYNGNGVATNSVIDGPYDVAIDPAGNVYVADSGDNMVRLVQLGGLPTLALTNVSVADAGSYTVVVSNPCGSVTSQVATVTILGPPAILSPLVNQEVVAGNDATFCVAATGTPPLYYSWYFNMTNLLQTGTSASLIVSNAAPVWAGSYSVVVSNGDGVAASGAAVLTVIPVPATPPYIAAIPDNYANVGSNLLSAISVTETNVPARQVTLTLGAEAPAGASISSNGNFSWTPALEQGSTTNVITIWAMDNGTPALSNSVTFRVVVNPAMQVSVGSGVVQMGNQASLSVNLYSSVSLTNVSFALATLSGYFTNWAISAATPEAVSASAQAPDCSQPQFNFVAQSGQPLLGAVSLGTITVQTLPDGNSDFAPLTVNSVMATAANAAPVSVFGQSGRLVLIGPQPLLEETLTNSYSRVLALYGKPGSNYTIISTTNFSDQATWTFVTNVTLPNPVQLYITPGPPPYQSEFFRAYQN
jgi:sugar lactone lactonase YvrE